MRATEFTNEEQLDELATESHRTKINQHLQKNGYVPIGDGVGAMVYSKDAGSVIKIIFPVNVEQMDSETEVFMTFYKFCQQTNSPHLPKFISIGGKHHETFVLDGEEFTMIAMEKLQPMKGIAQAIVWGISDNVQARAEWDDTLRDMTSVNFWKYYDSVPQKIASYINLHSREIYTEWAQFYQICENLYDLGRMKGFYWDLHTMNVMMRGNVPVIIDPWTC